MNGFYGPERTNWFWIRSGILSENYPFLKKSECNGEIDCLLAKNMFMKFKTIRSY